MADILFEGVSFNGDHWKTKTEKEFTEACKVEGKFNDRENQDKIIKEAWKVIRGVKTPAPAKED